jgi:hypothetical protein
VLLRPVEFAPLLPSTLPLFCHSPVFRIMSSFQRQSMLSDAAFNDAILTNLGLSSISTQKKLVIA